MNLLSYIFIAMIFLAWIHFIYNGIILPSIRMHLRNNLFALRDRLREMKIKKEFSNESKVVELLHDGINNVLDRLPFFTIETVLKLRENLKAEQSLIKEINSRLSMIENCKNVELKEIYKKTNMTLLYSFLANSGGLLLWIFPVFFVIYWISQIKVYVSDLVAIPSSKAERLAPNNRFA